LARVIFQELFEYAYQVDEYVPNYFCPTGYDTLLYKAIYNNGTRILLFVDEGDKIVPIAEVLQMDGKIPVVTDIIEDPEKKYIKILTKEQILEVAVFANEFIKIKETNGKYKPSFAVQI
jgi:uncharacterized radical SAM superfamily Fe-S cluster-containing enzyme